MHILGVRHHTDDKLFPRVIAYLSKFDFRGKTVAIEEPHSHFRNSSETFWAIVAKTIEERGGSVVAVDSLRMRKRQSLMHTFFERGGDPLHRLLERKLNLKRTIHMVQKADAAGATMLITGVAHAYDIKKILGRKADVHIIARPRQMMRYPFYAQSVRWLRNQYPRDAKEIKEMLSPAARNGTKLPRPRLRPKARVHRRK